MGNVDYLPDETSINLYFQHNAKLQNTLVATKKNPKKRRDALHLLAKALLKDGKVSEAWKVLLADDSLMR